MKVRHRYFTAAVCVALLGTLSGCSEPGLGNSPSDQVSEFGTVQFPLEATGESGFRYRLRNAVLEIRSKRTARVEAVLFSEDDVFSSFISTDLDAGEYQVTLQPGWFIEQVRNDGGGFGGSGSTGSTGGSFGGDSGGSGPTGSTDVSTGGSGPNVIGPAQPQSSRDIFDEPLPGPTATTTATATAPAVTVSGGGTNLPPPTTTGSGDGVVINAALESNAIQDFTIFPREESFVFFTFRVGDNVISFDPGRVNIGISIIEDGVTPQTPDLCERPVDARRPAVIETSFDAVGFHTLRDTFDAMAKNEGFATDGETLYHQIIDSYASADQARLEDAVHCGDETTNGVPSLNGFRIDCNRREHEQFDNLDQWQSTAFVNRLDLAPQSGAHCGQQRVVFSNNVNGRMFFIIEAQIPNPTPDLGVAGCEPLARFWAEQVRIEDPFERGLRLRQAFFDGDPELQNQGFGPFIAASHYTVGTGQIRTNNFDDGQWTLREFKLTTSDSDESELKAIPFPVAESPNGELWNDNLDLPAGESCRDAFVEAAQGVLTDETAAMGFIVPQECKNSESRNDFFTEDYGFHMSQGSGQLIDLLDQAGASAGLTAFDIANRARFSGSCIGCHNETAFSDLGNGVVAPFSLDFVHVGEFGTTCPDGNPCFATSSAVNDSFLPHRLSVMSNFVGVPLPPNCDDDFPEADAGVDESDDSDFSNETIDVSDDTIDVSDDTIDVSDDTDEDGTDDNSNDGDESDDNGEANDSDANDELDAGVANPSDDAPVVDVPEPVELPSADIPVEQLVELETEIRETYGDLTLGGQPAQVSH